MDLKHIEQRLMAILHSAHGWLPPEQLIDMQDLVSAGEPGVALENFCTQLEEHDVSVPRNTATELRSIAAAMGLKVSPWLDRSAE